MTILRLFVIITIACLCMQSCGKRRIVINRDMRRTIDTLSARQTYALRPVLDSVCVLKTDSLVSVMTDSILVVRREEIRKLLGQ